MIKKDTLSISFEHDKGPHHPFTGDGGFYLHMGIEKAGHLLLMPGPSKRRRIQ